MSIALLAAGLVTALVQVSPGAPRVIAIALDAREVTRVRDLSAPAANGAPWLVVGSTGQVTDRWTIEAYGPPEQRPGRVSRGVQVRLSGQGVGSRRSWSLSDTRPYAHVAIEAGSSSSGTPPGGSSRSSGK